MTLIDILHLLAAALLAAGSLLILIRILRGPSILDRMIASDVLISAVIVALAIEMVVNRHTRTLPVVLALSGTAILGSIVVARYVSRQDTVQVVDLDPAATSSDGAEPAP